jgi:hypothetical protein
MGISDQQWLRTNEKTEAFASLKLANELMDKVDDDPYHWKWVILAVHGALQATMVLAVTGSTQYGALSKESQEAIRAGKQALRHMADFPELYRRVKRRKAMALFVTSKLLEASPETDSAVRYLHRNLRNKFIHFLPSGWSIWIGDLPSVLDRCVSVIAFLAFESGNIFWIENPTRDELAALVHGLRSKLQAHQP